jgi:biotin/methionine sulfoxide reductase
MTGSTQEWRPHMAHWGGFEARSDGTRLLEVRPLADDPAPVALIENILTAQHDDSRVDQPYVRERWLKEGPGAPGRGDDRYVRTSWEEVLRLTSGEIERVYATTGPESVFGGSYGWSSAGRFHHAQSQVHRFLNSLGGYVASVGNYSYGAAQVLLPHVVGSVDDVMMGATSWESIAEHTDLFVAFGGLPAKNVAVSPGGIRRHAMRGHLAACRERGTEFVHVSPLRDDVPEEAGSRWVPARPGTDAALMSALAYVVVRDGLLDREFVDGWCVGYEQFEKYLLGADGGEARTPEWAESITGVSAAEIVALAHQMARGRTMITVSWSLQRTRHGEQPLWLAIVLAAMLGQIGLPGGGFGHGYGSMGYIGTPRPPVAVPALPQGSNPVETFIPVARIADMLMGAGQTYEFDGQELTYPDIRLVYWAGGNPFHHHQDLARLATAFAVPETVIVHESFWTATARHADIVLPASMTIERNDFAQGKNEPFLSAMPRLTAPAGQARSDYEIFAALAERLGVVDDFTAGRDEEGWLRHLYGQLEERLPAGGPDQSVPSFDEFWAEGVVRLPEGDVTQTLFADFRADPTAHPLATPSGKIEVFSSTIDAFGYDDFPGHPAWIEPEEWLGAEVAERFPLHLVANQPRGRLHSQLSVGEHSRSLQVAGREPLRMSPTDAQARGLSDGDLVEVSSARGRCLAGVVVSGDIRDGVVQLSTGARFAPFPDDPAFCQNGNPNVLTADRPTSRLTQGCAGQHSLVEVRLADAASSTFVEPAWRSDDV